MILSSALAACGAEPSDRAVPSGRVWGDDAAPADGAPGDASPSGDAASTDAARRDGSAADGGGVDVSVQDASMQDASNRDGSPGDASPLDAGQEAAAADAAPIDAAPPPDAPVGPFLDAAPGCPAESVAAICARVGANCGSVTTLDVCGSVRTVDCGTCPAGSTCGGGPAPNACATCVAESTATFCGRHHAHCGTITRTDNCHASRTVDCGPCRLGEVCSATNQCGCTTETDTAYCARMGADCGTLAGNDNCGAPRTASCGTCRTGSTCGGDGVPNRCQILHVCEPPGVPPVLNMTPYVSNPAPFAQARCTSAQAGAFIDACLAQTASAATCSSWRDANANCAACVVTPESGAWGPVVSTPADVSASNPLGLTDRSFERGAVACLDHFRAGCGFAHTKHDACLGASCDQTVGCIGATPAAILTCRTSAQASSCTATYASAYAAGTGACAGVLSTGPTSSVGDGCVLPFDQRVAPTDGQVRAYFTGLIQVFCGP